MTKIKIIKEKNSNYLPEYVLFNKIINFALNLLGAIR